VGGQIGTYVDTARTIADIFGEYYSLPPELRRANFDDILWSVINKNDKFMYLWTAWLPDTLDDMDFRYGPYNSAFTRGTGTVSRMMRGYPNWEKHLNDVIQSPNTAIIMDPVWQTVNNQEIPIICIMYTIVDTQTRKPVGIVGLNYITSLQNIVDDVGKDLYDGKGFAGVYTNDGMTVAHFDQSRVKGYIYENPTEQAMLGGHMDAVVESIKNGGINGGKPLSLSTYSETLETNVYIIYYPITIIETNTPWCMVVVIPMNEVTRAVWDLTVFIIILAAALIIVSAVIAFVIASRVVQPIRAMSLTLKDISEGEGDLTKTIAAKGNDETSDMAHYFNLTLEKIKKLIITIKRQSANLMNIGNELAANMTQTATAINEITATIQSIKGKAINQSASVTETKATMEQITVNIDKLNSQVEKQTSSVSQSSSAIEEMLANIQSVTNTLIKNSGNVKNLMAASETGKNSLQGVAEDIREIAHESEGLFEINLVMENIASQTNLLSMNAAIEAAHAGEAGKGFAVVADEIRKLAENSWEQSKTISAVLKKIKDSIDKIIKSTDSVLNEFGAIDGGVKTVSQQEENIRNAMEEQSVGSKQILQSISELNGITHQVKDGSQEMLEGSKEVINEGVNLEKVTLEITGGMNEMAMGADQINAAVNSVNDLSSKNRENIDLLVHEVSKFKVD
jgi:methyl-accepting chemotaxis protein